MRRLLGSSVAFWLAGAFLLSGTVQAQRRGYWPVPGGDVEHNNWQEAETKITTDTVAKDFKFLWKIKLGTEVSKSNSFSEPLLLPGLITGRGFKDMTLVGGYNSLYSVDSVLGTLIWKHDLNLQSPVPEGSCGGSAVQMIMEPPRVIHFGVHRPHAKHHGPADPAAPSSASNQRRIGVIPDRGYFGLKGIYVLTGDGYLHEQILATGLDYAPPVKFLPKSNDNASALNITDHVVYTETGRGCRNVPNSVWSIDLNTAAYTVNGYKTGKLSVWDLAGPTIGSDGTVYATTGGGSAYPGHGLYPHSTIALTAPYLKKQDWYAPTGKERHQPMSASPVTFDYDNKQLVAAPGKHGSLVLLDGTSLGGSDHHTPLAQTSDISKSGDWAGLASWQDKDGAVWVLASYSGRTDQAVKFAYTNGPAPHGSVIAFKVEEKDGHPVLTPAWISRDLTNPAPPAIANGVVFALSGGNASRHAFLYALNAATGKELYSSGDAINSYARLSGMAVGDGRVFFTTHDNTLYSFGIPMEH